MEERPSGEGTERRKERDGPKGTRRSGKARKRNRPKGKGNEKAERKRSSKGSAKGESPEDRRTKKQGSGTDRKEREAEKQKARKRNGPKGKGSGKAKTDGWKKHEVDEEEAENPGRCESRETGWAGRKQKVRHEESGRKRKQESMR